MKKIITFVVSVSLISSFSSLTFAAAKKKAVKKPAKIIAAPVKKTIVIPVIKPAPVPVVMPDPQPLPQPRLQPAPAKPRAKVPEGRGILLGLNAGYDAGLFGVAGNLDYDLTNFGATGVRVRIGGNYLGGVNPDAGTSLMKALSLKLGGLFNMTDFFTGSGQPLNFYIGGAYLFPVKVTGDDLGSGGTEAYLGANYVIADFGTINMEAGYASLKYSKNAAAVKGLDLKLGISTAF